MHSGSSGSYTRRKSLGVTFARYPPPASGTIVAQESELALAGRTWQSGATQNSMEKGQQECEAEAQ